MNKLFLKILVSFWLALILFTGLSLWLTSQYLEHTRNESKLTHPRAQLAEYNNQAQKIASSDGIDGLKSWLKTLDKREAIPYLLVNSNGKDLINRPVSHRVLQRIRKRERHYEDDDGENHEHRRAYRRPVVLNGQYYHLIPDFQNVTLPRLLNRPRLIIFPILVASLVSGIVCFLLAQYITSPITRLRKATRNFAKGNLEQRVWPTMGKRKDEISDLAIDFDYMAEQLQQLLASHKQLLRDASHELRSPLARLQIALGLARQSCTPKELDRIEREAERLNDIISQLLSLTRLDGQINETKHKEFNLTKTLQALCEDASFEATPLNKQVIFKQKTSVNIVADETLISSALENIIRNAVSYTDEHTSVDVDLSIDSKIKNQINITVRDHGPGIPEDMLSRVFEPFVRVSEARDRNSGGYGLGLAIASRAIQLHNGKISALNEPDGGMKITIFLPTNHS